MKSLFKIKYPHLFATLLILALVITLRVLGLVTVPQTVALLMLGQMAMLAVSPRRAVCFMASLSAAQLEEFADIMEGFKEYAGILKELKGEGGWSEIKKLPQLFDALSDKMRRVKSLNAGGPQESVRWRNGEPVIPETTAAALVLDFANQCAAVSPKCLETFIPNKAHRDTIIAESRKALGLPAETKAGGALSPTDIPLPTIYAPVIVELVYAYGAARKWATVYPLGAGLVKLPMLAAGEDTFGFLGSGTAGQSQNVPQKEVTASLVTFTANKFGGLIRIPTELEEDTFVPLGQFLARYIARQFAKMEDNCLFNADGTATYAGIIGVAKYCNNNAAYLQVLAAGGVKPTQAGVADFRAMRGRVNPAVLSGITQAGQETVAAYYMNPTMESLLVTFNTIGQPLVYMPGNGIRPPTLDGFPIRWIGVSQANSQVAAPNTAIAFFGDVSYWYLGERGAPRVEISRDVFFATDELAMRALERIDVEAMAVDAMATLQTAAQ